MRAGYKLVVASAFVGVVAVAAAAFAQSPSPSGSTGTPGPLGARGAQGAGKMGHRIVHSESKVQLADGSFATMILDSGEVTKVEGSTVTIKRVDGESVSATATDSTKVSRDRTKGAKISDIKVGDHARIMRMVKDGVETVRGIHAISPEFAAAHAAQKGHGGRHRRDKAGHEAGSSTGHPAEFASDIHDVPDMDPDMDPAVAA